MLGQHIWFCVMGQIIWFAWWHQRKVFNVKHIAWRLHSSGPWHQGKRYVWRQAQFLRFLELLSPQCSQWKKNLPAWHQPHENMRKQKELIGLRAMGSSFSFFSNSMSSFLLITNYFGIFRWRLKSVIGDQTQMSDQISLMSGLDI